ncbi:unnamed protein product [Gordionus sp. m RMFG-2023]
MSINVAGIEVPYDIWEIIFTHLDLNSALAFRGINVGSKTLSDEILTRNHKFWLSYCLDKFPLVCILDILPHPILDTILKLTGGKFRWKDSQAKYNIRNIMINSIAPVQWRDIFRKLECTSKIGSLSPFISFKKLVIEDENSNISCVHICDDYIFTGHENGKVYLINIEGKSRSYLVCEHGLEIERVHLFDKMNYGHNFQSYNFILSCSLDGLILLNSWKFKENQDNFPEYNFMCNILYRVPLAFTFLNSSISYKSLLLVNKYQCIIFENLAQCVHENKVIYPSDLNINLGGEINNTQLIIYVDNFCHLSFKIYNREKYSLIKIISISPLIQEQSIPFKAMIRYKDSHTLILTREELILYNQHKNSLIIGKINSDHNRSSFIIDITVWLTAVILIIGSVINSESTKLIIINALNGDELIDKLSKLNKYDSTKYMHTIQSSYHNYKYTKVNFKGNEVIIWIYFIEGAKKFRFSMDHRKKVLKFTNKYYVPFIQWELP